MTGPEYNDRIIKVLNGNGIRTDEAQGRGEDFISSIRDSCRGEALNLLSQKGGGVAAAFYQETYASETDIVQQEKCIYMFPCPQPLYKMNGQPWTEWIGGQNWNRNTRFRLAPTRSALVELNAHHIVGRSGVVRAYYDNTLNYFIIYNNKGAKNYAVRQIFANPYDVKEYNIDKDNYPYPVDQDDLLMDLILQRYFKTTNGPADAVSDSRNTNQLPRTQR